MEGQTGSDAALRFVVTGGLGFIGNHLVNHLLRKYPRSTVLVIDNNSYAAAGESRPVEVPLIDLSVFRGRIDAPGLLMIKPLREPPEILDTGHAGQLLPVARGRRILSDDEWPEHRAYLMTADINNTRDIAPVMRSFRPHGVFHLAAETHVDRSIEEGNEKFTQANVLGTHRLLNALLSCRDYLPLHWRIVVVSTDEVYGSMHTKATEEDPLSPRNVYSATKAAAEHMALAYHNTYQLPVVVTRGCNTFGFYQHPEKFIPVVARCAAEGRPIPIYGDGQQTREWMTAEDHAAGIDFVRCHGILGEPYNVGTGVSLVNLDVARSIVEGLGKDIALLNHVTDRPGHDRAYRLDTSRLEDLGWEPAVRDKDSILGRIVETAAWYASPGGHSWLEKTKHHIRRLGLPT